MYADRQLTALAQRKQLLQARISVHRMECALAGARLAPPIALLDRVWGHWRRLSPWLKSVGVPLGMIAARKITRARGGGGTSRDTLGSLLRMLPLAIEVWKALRERGRGGVR